MKFEENSRKTFHGGLTDLTGPLVSLRHFRCHRNYGILHGEAKSEFFTIGIFVLLKVCLIIFSTLTVISVVLTCSKENLIAKLSHVNKNKGVAD